MIIKRVKRPRGKESREKAINIYKKKTTLKDIKAKACKEEHVPLLNVFVVIRYNYKRMILYKILSNSVRKITTKFYT